MKNTWIIFIVLALAGCAHESRITPSSGHIDGQTDAQQAKSTAASTAGIPKPVTSNAFVPPPKPKAKEQTYSVVVNEVPVKEILFALARESKLNIDIHPAIQGRVTLNAVDQPLPAILERLAKQVDLTYKIEGNVLNITPDMPVLRSYKVDYVNMSRDTAGSIGAAAEIATAGRAASTGSTGTTGSASSTGGNSSRTLVSSQAKNHFWETLIQNIKDILAETDKEVIIGRSGNTSQSGTQVAAANTSGTSPQAAPAASQASNPATTAAQEREEARTEYKTLFAAQVIANPEAGVITVRATNKQHEKVQDFLDKVLASAKRQVLIEATIVEVQLSDRFQSGVDWSRLASNGGKNGLTFNQTLGGAPLATGNQFIVGYSNKSSGFLGTVAASIRLLETFGNTKVLSSPKLMALNNQTAVLKAVDNLVYFTITADTTTASVGPAVTTFTTTPQTVPTGVVMSVTPQINENGGVTLTIRPTISRKVDQVLDPNPTLKTVGVQSLVPVIQVREMESVLKIESGNTIVMGGLMQDNINKATDAVPGISKLPFVGRLFQGKDDTVSKTELVIFLRPTVITNASLESDELLSYKQFLPTQQLQQTADEPAN